MMKYLVVLGLILGIASLAFSQTITDGVITVGTSPTSLGSVPSHNFRDAGATITVEGGAIRWSTRTTPTAQLGHIGSVGDTIVLNTQADVEAFRVLRNTGVSGATIFYTVWGQR